MLKPITILLVEDSPTDRAIYCRLLNQDNLHTYEIVEFDSGEDALEWCQQGVPNLILLDYSLPEMDGLEFLERLRQQCATPEQPVILLIAEGDTRHIVEAMKQGVQAYLDKDKLNGDKLCLTVDRVLERMRLRRVLQRQQDQQRLVAEIALRIRQSLELDDILNTAVREVRSLLDTDRVVIYRFAPDWSGRIVVESVGEGWTSVLGEEIHDPCFERQWAERYRQGRVGSIENIDTAYLQACHVDLLTQFQVRANLVVPILQGQHLWGLLIAHHCVSPRQWQADEVEVLQQLAVQLSIAIQQAELHAQLRAELTQRQNKTLRQLAGLLELAEDAIIGRDAAGRILFWNRGAEHLYGWTQAQVLHQVTHILLQTQFPISYEAIQENLFEQGHWEGELLHTCEDGRQIIVESRQTLMRDGMDQLIAILEINRNITARKQAELALQEREETLRLLIKYAPANIAMFDQDMNYIMISQRGVDACQLGSIEAVVGRSHYEACPGIPEEWKQIHQRCLAGAIEKCDESLYIRADGTSYWTRWEIHPWYQANQKIGGIILFSEDITDRKQAQQELQHSVEELTRLNQLKDDFLSTVSHELRTPISSIKMATQMLEIRLNPLGVFADSSSPISRYFQILNDECQREIGLINNLLDLTRLDAGTEPLSFTTIELQYFIPHIVEPFVERAHNQQQHLEIHIPENLPSITTDLSYLERILSELLNNACKYTPAEESITLFAQAIPTGVEIRVSNSGVEISEQERGHIFDRFYRIPNNDPWKYGGTGLGLALVKKLVESLHGTIEVASTQRQTSFTVQLPY